MAAKRPVPEVVALLETYLSFARSGHITDVLLIARLCDGEYLDDWFAEDLPDMVLELRSTVIRVQTNVEMDTTEH